MKRTILLIVAAFFTFMLLMACSSQKEPAELAMQAAEQAVNATKGEAAKFAPEQMAALETALASVKEKMEKKEYEAVLAEAQAIPGKAKDVLAAATAKKDELTKKWTDLSQKVPQMVGAIQTKVDELSQLKPKKLPKDMTVEKLAEAKTALEGIKTDFAKVQETFKAGKMADAIAAAAPLQEKALKAMEALGIAPAPEAAPAVPATPAAPAAPALPPAAK